MAAERELPAHLTALGDAWTDDAASLSQWHELIQEMREEAHEINLERASTSRRSEKLSTGRGNN